MGEVRITSREHDRVRLSGHAEAAPATRGARARRATLAVLAVAASGIGVARAQAPKPRSAASARPTTLPATRPAAAAPHQTPDPATTPSAPSTRPGTRPATRRAADPQKVATLLGHLERDYAAKAAAKDWVTRAMGVLSLARLPQPPAAGLLLDRCEKDDHTVVRLLAWQAVLARAPDLAAADHARWVSATLAMAEKDAFRGELREPLLAVLATAPPTPRARKVWARLFDQASAWEPRDVPTLRALGACAATWRSRPLAEGLVKALAVRDLSVRAEQVLLAAGCPAKPAADRLDPAIFEDFVSRPGERSVARRHLGYAELYKQVQRDAAAWVVRDKAAWQPEPAPPAGTPWREMRTPAFVAPPIRLADVHPDDPFWTNDLELGRPDLARMEVAFVVDATGSMDAVLGWLQRDVSRLMRALSAVYADPPRIGVVFYRDVGGAFVTRSAPLTDRLKDLEPPLRLMTADGGGDVPEAVLDGLRAALGLGWTKGDRVGRRIILIGDAPPKPGTEPACEQIARAGLDVGVRTLCVQVTTPDGRNDLSSFARIADAGGGATIPVEFRRVGQQVFVDENGKDVPLQQTDRPEAQLTVAAESADGSPGDRILALLVADAINPQYRDRIEPLARTLLAACAAPADPERRLGFAPNTTKLYPGVGKVGKQ